ncbi:uncharacterized protein LOC131550574 [Onychostoma macrolepis]|uniref:Immunoglobulin domain-containing protein n=1 Tax=Onychostoma macrolepis TaxID=369639 RepID=A0A7J6DIM8_9TELE|nr:uncharacterized protein LOC131550574 [Onychostoma macrolepis]KAF4119128.1 hypothetical protein G5714_001179 [Onychostoma macrolepis]
MKMLVLTHSTAVICAVFIITGAVSGEDVKKAVGGTVSFSPDTLESPVTSITWKHVSLATVKAIEWDVDDGVIIPNQRFKDITTLDEKTGQITITNLKVEHSGDYTIDINSKEQGQRFSLEVMEEVPKPNITVEESGNPDVVYLRCEFSGMIIWTNSAGETLEGNKNHKPGEFITVKNTRNPENYYTCTLKNAVSDETSDPVYERELFKTEEVPKPNITVEERGNPDTLNLVCEYDEKIIWKNSAGQILTGSKHTTKGESITVKNTRNPENYYTCTLKNAVSEKTSDPVYERDLFVTESSTGLIVGIVILVILLIIIGLICAYLRSESIYNRVNECCPGIESVLRHVDCCAEKRKQYSQEPKGPGTKGEDNPLKSSSDAENVEENDYVNTETDGDKREGAENSNEPLKADSDGGEQVAKL